MSMTPSLAQGACAIAVLNSLNPPARRVRPVHPESPVCGQGAPRRGSIPGADGLHLPHIGNMRAYVFADVVGRTLSWKGYKLTHVSHHDVPPHDRDADAGEDKLEKAAAENAKSIWDIARHYTEAYGRTSGP